MLKKIKEEYELFKFSDGHEKFLEWYLKRSAKDLTKLFLSWLLVAFGVWLMFDLRRVLVMLATVLVLSAIMYLVEVFNPNKKTNYKKSQ